LDDAERMSLATMLNTVEFEDGEHIITADDEADGMFIVESGTAEAVDHNGKMLKQYAAGDFFGELALVDATARRKATVKSTGFSTTVLKLPLQAYKTILDSNEGVRMKIAQARAEYGLEHSPAAPPARPPRGICCSARAAPPQPLPPPPRVALAQPPKSAPPPLPSALDRHEKESASVMVSVAGPGGEKETETTPADALLEIFATTASFGRSRSSHSSGQGQVLRGHAEMASPELADGPLTNAAMLRGKIAVVRRGGVTFVSKARRAQEAGAIGLIVINSNEKPFLLQADSGDSGADVGITVVCVRQSDGYSLLQTLHYSNCVVSIAINASGGGGGDGSSSQHPLIVNE
jgi:hypothetical protein